jgi:hypothetical protein
LTQRWKFTHGLTHIHEFWTMLYLLLILEEKCHIYLPVIFNLISAALPIHMVKIVRILQIFVGMQTQWYFFLLVWFMVFNATFNNILVISWQSILLVEETRVPGENHRPIASHWQTLLHNVVSSTPRHERGSNSQL